jgi:ATP-binding cassette subfamily B protein
MAWPPQRLCPRCSSRGAAPPARLSRRAAPARPPQVEEAARAANAAGFIADLPAGYDTFVGEQGVQLRCG